MAQKAIHSVAFKCNFRSTIKRCSELLYISEEMQELLHLGNHIF